MIELGKRLAIAAGVLAAIGLTAVPRPVEAGGIGPGAAVGLGLGAFALGATVANPYGWGGGYPGYSYYGYPYGYGGYSTWPAPSYYPAQPYYSYRPRTCWNGYSYTYC